MSAVLLGLLRAQQAKGLKSLALTGDQIRDVLVGSPASPVSINVRRDLGPKATVRVTGDLDLRSLRGHDGGPLPPIHFRGVIFLGELRLAASALSRLRLRDCRFHRLDARDADIFSTLDLRGAQGLLPDDANEGAGDDPARCTIDLCNARVDGDIRLRDARLNVGSGQTQTPPGAPPRYALDLRGAEITGSLRLKTGFEAIGGVTIADATIGGDLHCHGAHLVAVHGAALRAQSVTVHGGVFCCAFRDQPFVANGKHDGALVFQHARIGRMYLNGAQVDAGGGTRVDDRPAGVALDLSHAVIAGVVSVGDAIARLPAMDCSASFFGQVTLRGAETGGDVRFSDTRITWTMPDDGRDAPRYVFDAVGSRIRGSLHINDGFQAVGGVSVADAVISGDVFLWGAKLVAPPRGDAFRGRNVAIGGVLRGSRLRPDAAVGTSASAHLSCVGGVALPNAAMDIAALNGVRITGPRARLDLQSCRIRGTLSLTVEPTGPYTATSDGPLEARLLDGPQIDGPLIVTDARIEGDVVMDGLVVACDARNTWIRTGQPLVNLTGTTIEGDLQMRSVTTEKGARPFAVGWRDGSRPSSIGVAPDICLKAASVGRNLEIETAMAQWLSAETVQIGGSCQLGLSATDGARADMNGTSTKQGYILSGSRLKWLQAKGLSIAGHLEIRDCTLVGLAQFDRADIGGDLILEDIRFKTPAAPLPDVSDRPAIDSLYLDGSAVRGQLRARNVGFEDEPAPPTIRSDPNRVGPTPPPHVSLMSVSVRTIDDEAAWAWSPHLRLQLRGLTYEAFAFLPHGRESRTASFRDHRNATIQRLIDRKSRLAWMWLMGIIAAGVIATGLCWWRAPDETGYALALSIGVGVLALLTTWEFLDPNRPDRIDSRLLWLTQQYQPRRLRRLHDEYHPQPLMQAAKVYRNQGLFEYADRALTLRLFTEAHVKRVRLIAQQATGGGPLSFISRLVDGCLGGGHWLISHIYYVLFRFGLSAVMSLVSFLAYWMLGVLIVSWADDHDSLIVKPDARTAPPARCSTVMAPTVYALDIAVPVLDLGAKDVCVAGPTVSPSASPPAEGRSAASLRQSQAVPAPEERQPATAENWWHKVLAIYGLGGWVVCSLTILTLTGVFRRLAEN